MAAPDLPCNAVNATCPSVQVCCVLALASGLDYCAQPNTCGVGYYPFDCTSDADCPGNYRCAITDYLVFKTLQCKNAGPAETHVGCDPNQANPCAGGLTCKKFERDWYWACQ
jgi:hypothetical protein